jgi:hypothetical protein
MPKKRYGLEYGSMTEADRSEEPDFEGVGGAVWDEIDTLESDITSLKDEFNKHRETRDSFTPPKDRADKGDWTQKEKKNWFGADEKLKAVEQELEKKRTILRKLKESASPRKS